MNLDQLLDFIRLENQRLEDRFHYQDNERKAFAHTIKLNEEVGEFCTEVLA